jgi:glutathione S-transferase
MAQTMEDQLAESEFLVGNEYSVADIIAYPVATVSMKRHPGNLDGHPNLARWAAKIGARPAVQRGMTVPA